MSHHSDRDAIKAVIDEMQHHADDWVAALAAYQTPDGDIREECLPEYEYTKDDHGWSALENLAQWVSALRAAIPGDQKRA